MEDPRITRIRARLDRIKQSRRDLVKAAQAAGNEHLSIEDDADFRRATEQIGELEDRLAELTDEAERAEQIGRQALTARTASASAVGGSPTEQAVRADPQAWGEYTARKITQARTETRAFNSGVIDSYLPVPGAAMATLPTRVSELFNTRTLDVADVGGQTGGFGQPNNGVSYLRQTVRTNNAEFVADNATKPTSVFTLVEVEDRLRVLAHLSEAIPRRYFDDAPSLQRFLVDEMRNGLIHRLNDATVNGDDTAGTDEFDGLIQHAGSAVAFDTDVPTTTAGALMGQLDAGETPTHWVFRGSDWNTLSLTKEQTSGQYLFGTPADGPGRQLHGLPVVLEPQMPAGFALLVDRNMAEYVGERSIRVDWDGSGDLFDANQVKARVEWRVVLAVYRPSAFKYIDIAA